MVIVLEPIYILQELDNLIQKAQDWELVEIFNTITLQLSGQTEIETSISKSIFNGLNQHLKSPDNIRVLNTKVCLIARRQIILKIFEKNPEKFRNLPKILSKELAESFLLQLEKKNCPSCSNSLSEIVYHYEHSSGWIVPEMEKRQWLYLECPKCFHQWSLWKLGVSKTFEIPNEIYIDNNSSESKEEGEETK
jgi:uncharacterized protein with PIN domain